MPRLAAVLALAFASLGAQANDRLWALLKSEPNLVVLMRHTQSGGGHPLAWDESGRCQGESILTRKGKAHARRIGEAFASHGIAPHVISSPMCRCTETAQIAFGDERVTDPELREVASADAQRTRAFEGKARALLAAQRGAAPLVFVSHRPNIDRLTMELIDEPELLVGRVDERGEIDVLGKITLPP